MTPSARGTNSTKKPGNIAVGYTCILALALLAGCRSVPSLHPTTAEESKMAPARGRILVGSTLPENFLIHQVRPIYPKEAKRKRIQGTVRFDVEISKTGVVSEIHLKSGNPILVPAARDAVKQWLYAPTILNGEPVEVKTTIDINFNLDQ